MSADFTYDAMGQIVWLGLWVPGFLATISHGLGRAFSCRMEGKNHRVKICFDAKDTDARDVTPVLEGVKIAEKYGLKVMVHCNHSPVPVMEIVKAL